MWAGVYGALATYGYAPHEVDLMECWTAALLMGHGETGDEDVILRGSRMVSHPKDDDPDGATDLLTKGDPHASTRAAMLAGDGERPVVAMRPVKPSDR